MANRILTLVKINGVDVTANILTYAITRAYGDSIATCSLDFIHTVNDDVPLVNGMSVEIWRGFVTSTDKKEFDGFIQTFVPNAGKIKITAKDKIWNLVREEVNTIYDSSVDVEAGVISEIFKDLVTTYGGLNANSGTIQDSGTTVIIEKFRCIHTDVFERCRRLAQIQGWQFYYKPDTDLVYFEPKGFVTSPTVLTVGDNIVQIPSWNYDVTDMVNDMTIIGASQEVETTEQGRIGTTAGYTTGQVSIDFTPVSVKVYADASNPPTTLRIGGVEGSTISFYYSVDQNNQLIMPKVGTLFNTNDYVQVQYSYLAPVPVHMYNQGSIDTYGKFTKTVTFTDIKTVEDATTRGKNYLGKYSTPFIYTTVRVTPDPANDYDVGQIVQVIDTISNPNVNKLLVINRIVLNYPANYDELYVGDKEWRLSEWQALVEERLKRIEEEEIQNQGIVVELVDIDNTQDSYQVVRNRYFIVEPQTASGTNLFIFDNDLYNTIGTNSFGDAGLSAKTTYALQWSGGVYKEYVLDTDFYDAINSTGTTWNISAHSITITASNTAFTNAFDVGNIYTFFTVAIPSGVGAGTVWISGDNKATWQTVPLGTRTGFASSDGTGTFLKIVNGAGTLVLQPTYKSNGRMDQPAIQVTLE